MTKRVIARKILDTEKADYIGGYSYGHSSDGHYVSEGLYFQDGQFFIYGEGGGLSSYGVSCGQNSMTGSKKLFLVSDERAYEFFEEHMPEEIEIFEKYFKK
jgi:hypothetical protein